MSGRMSTVAVVGFGLALRRRGSVQLVLRVYAGEQRDFCRGRRKKLSFLTAWKVNAPCRRPLSPPRRYFGPRLRLSAPMPNY